MRKLIKPFVSLLRLIKEVKDFRLAYLLLPKQFTPKLTHAGPFNVLGLPHAESEFTYTHRQLTLFDYDGDMLLKFIKSKYKIETKLNKNILTLRCNKTPIKLFVDGYDNLKVIEEIFIDQLYAFQAKGEFVVCDVGVNIGAASLFFASFENIEKVYGFEPFPDTMRLAEKNIEINDSLKSKIELFGFGLGWKDEIKEVPNPLEGFLGGTTSDFMIEQLPGKLKRSSISVEIQDICKVLNIILKANPDKKLILKLDCEGAEYEIIESLDLNNLLQKISLCFIEYHFRGKAPIVERLIKNNFTVIAPGSDIIQDFAMVYGVKI